MSNRLFLIDIAAELVLQVFCTLQISLEFHASEKTQMLIHLADPYRALPVSGNKSSMVNQTDMVTAHVGLPL